MTGHTVEGSQPSRDLGTVETDVTVTAERGSVDLTAGAAVTVRIEGDRNSVTVRGDQPVDLVVTGERNGVTVAEAVDLTLTDEGQGNSVGRERFTEPPELIEQSKDEAFAELGWFGLPVVTYQTEATEREYCHGCGADADGIVNRHEERVLTVGGLSMTVRTRARSDQCPNCADYIPETEVELTDAERRDIYG